MNEEDDYDEDDEGASNKPSSSTAAPLSIQQVASMPTEALPEHKEDDLDKAAEDEEEGEPEEADFDEAFDEAFDDDEEAGPTQDPAGDTAASEEPAAKRAKKSLADEEAEKKRLIINAMNEQQLDRYESFRRSSLARPKIKKYLSTLLGYAPSDRVVIAMCGMGKVFVGELIESARILAAEEGDFGPLKPCYVRRAYQNLQFQQRIPRKHSGKRLLR
ncbi:hypothetical protein CEUSTIGMA_g5740.t1 [Chlamydomonas eustigma]|uniref:TAFII28-like protein domain-containing protein n=1 Tax=Chlamydomonas eustigma TaxID=1157962 RepID=A0A250X5F6_9CHLO|nr:hypothetical protein CEUSTIGMA_g5740.t1 [Chlamydomonas eustigma]|eukprot:GAX78298.1 hypothetical protein CEUSTIGMA_g5740.t1 [Chlamydomonas eustigma]